MPPPSSGIPPRVVIDHVRPTVECGTLPAKAAVRQPVEVSADLVIDGHDLVVAVVRHGGPRRRAARPVSPMVHSHPGLDRYSGLIVPTEMGAWDFEVLALPDAYGSWVRDLRLRQEAGQDVELELEVGARLVDETLATPTRAPRRTDQKALRALAAQLRDATLPTEARVSAAAHAAALDLMRRTAAWDTAAVAGPFPLWVDRELATFSAWYEMFPRSIGADPPRSGTLRTAERELPRIAAMGFDIVYLPPIHPIGHTHRKGPNNTLTHGLDDPGSPWAIGSEAGGHTAVHPDLGTVDDLRHFVQAAKKAGLEVALDYAIQCSPDHPWVTEHPQWFEHRPDGSIRYAENPPKRYQDIYPLDFETSDRENLDIALIDVVLFWIGCGVKVFRVDNPHTKALAFWRRLITTVQARHPDVLFLAEAFARPRVMERLAKIGFTQSYTYFTWRTGRDELAAYLTELAHTEMVDWFRPCFWPNTPDILHEFLQRGGPPAFRLRAVLAALTVPSWGVYSGYELCEWEPVREGSEEYLDSEKYQYRPRTWNQPHSIAPLLTRLNDIRRRHRDAIAQLRTLRLHAVEGSGLLAVTRMNDARTDVLLIVVNLDPLNAEEGVVHLDLEQVSLPGDAPFEAHDELTDTTYMWTGPRHYVRLDPSVAPAHVLHLRPRS